MKMNDTCTTSVSSNWTEIQLISFCLETPIESTLTTIVVYSFSWIYHLFFFILNVLLLVVVRLFRWMVEFLGDIVAGSYLSRQAVIPIGRTTQRTRTTGMVVAFHSRFSDGRRLGIRSHSGKFGTPFTNRIPRIGHSHTLQFHRPYHRQLYERCFVSGKDHSTNLRDDGLGVSLGMLLCASSIAGSVCSGRTTTS
jgi:hypothetical protein